MTTPSDGYEDTGRGDEGPLPTAREISEALRKVASGQVGRESPAPIPAPFIEGDDDEDTNTDDESR